MSTDAQTIRQYYDAEPMQEWNRVGEDSIEYLLTEKRLKRYIRPGDRVLDVGGGPGRYALMLAAMGCQVTLMDLSPGNIALAGQLAAQQGLSPRLLVGDAREEPPTPRGPLTTSW